MSEETSVEKELEDNPVTARGACYDVVADELSDARNADFRFHYAVEDGNGHALSGRVDYQDGTGADVGQEWTCNVDWSPESQSWSVAEVTLADQ